MIFFTKYTYDIGGYIFLHGDMDIMLNTPSAFHLGNYVSENRVNEFSYA